MTAVWLLILLMAGTACMSSSQVPLSVREREQRPAYEELYDEDWEQTESAPVVDTERLERIRLEREAQIREREEEHRRRTNLALTEYVLAQTAFFNGSLSVSLRHIQRGIDHKETPDLLALAGAIYHARGDQARSNEFWSRAVELDPEVVSDMYPGMRQWFENLGNPNL